MKAHRRSGFTLIEILIVVAIIAIIAAIAIPGLLASQRASNERNASAGLKTFSIAESDFRASDRDGNKIADFWTGDLAGLYGVCPPDTNDPVKLIEVSAAGADHDAVDKTATAPTATATTGMYVGQSYYSTRSPKASYWFRVLRTDEDANPYGIASGSGLGLAGAYFNRARFAFEAYPESRQSGRNIFIVSEGNTIFKRGITNTYVLPASNATLEHLSGSTTALTRFPTPNDLKSDFGKLD